MVTSGTGEQVAFEVTEQFVDELECIRKNFADLVLVSDEELVAAHYYADSVLASLDGNVPKNRTILIEYLDFLIWSAQIKLEMLWRNYTVR